MIGKRTAAAACGVAFGFLISWGQFTDPDRIRAMLLLKDLYLYEMMFSAMAVAFIGLRVLRRLRVRALATKQPIAWETQRPEARHVIGAAVFGLGWSLTDSCPAPIAAQLAQGMLWAVVTVVGVLVGIELYLRRQEGRSLLARAPVRRPSVPLAQPD